MEAIVLAGGLGTRLRAVVGELPKPMAPVAGRPFLEILLDRLAGQGIDAVVLSVGYKAPMIQAHFGEAYKGMAIRYAVEPEPLGTGGACRLAWKQVCGPRAFVLNGDTYVELDYAAVARCHQQQSRPMTMVVTPAPDEDRYDGVTVADGLVRGMASSGRSHAGYINAGVYLVERALLDDPNFAACRSLERDFLEPHVASLRPAAYVADSLFIDIGVPADYRRAQDLLAREASP